MKGESQLKARIIDIVRILIHQGLVKTSGHVSARVDEGHFFITGHLHAAGRSLANIRPQEVLLCNLKGEPVKGKGEPPEEIFIHSCIYEARSEVKGIIHAHPLFSTVLGIAGKSVVPVITTGIIFAPRVPVYDDPNHVDTKERGRALARALADAPAILIRGHGSVAVGESLEQTAAVALRLEDNAQMQFMAACLGEPRPILREEASPALIGRAGSLESARALLAHYKEQMARAT